MDTDLRHSTELVIGRPERVLEGELALARLIDHRVLVTGAGGSIGRRVCQLLADAGIHHLCTDVTGDFEMLDVRDGDRATLIIGLYAPTVIFHFAGAKHAPEGEEDPWNVARVNTIGTLNVTRAAPEGCRVVTASTCKAADPETAYGASKLIAERMTLNAGHGVARYFNVPESDQNVFRHWEQLPPDEPIPFTACRRYLMSMNEAIAVTLWAVWAPSGRWSIDPGSCQPMVRVAARLYPNRELVELPPRRGDRMIEPVKGASERFERYPQLGAGNLYRITSPHDPR